MDIKCFSMGVKNVTTSLTFWGVSREAVSIRLTQRQSNHQGSLFWLSAVPLSVERSQLPVGHRGSFLMLGQADMEVQQQSPGRLRHCSQLVSRLSLTGRRQSNLQNDPWPVLKCRPLAHRLSCLKSVFFPRRYSGPTQLKRCLDATETQQQHRLARGRLTEHAQSEHGQNLCVFVCVWDKEELG